MTNEITEVSEHESDRVTKQIFGKLAKGLMEITGGKEGLAEFGQKVSTAIREVLPPDLLARYDAVTTKWDNIVAAGKNPVEDKAIFEEFVTLLSDPEYQEIVGAMFSNEAGNGWDKFLPSREEVKPLPPDQKDALIL